MLTTIAGLTARVLVVASQKLVREGIRSELSQRRGLEVVETASGREAVALAAKSPFDLVLLELEVLHHR